MVACVVTQTPGSGWHVFMPILHTIRPISISSHTSIQFSLYKNSLCMRKNISVKFLLTFYSPQSRVRMLKLFGMDQIL